MTVLGRKGLLGLALRAARAAHSASNGSPGPLPDEVMGAPSLMMLFEVVMPVPLDVVHEELMASRPVPTCAVVVVVVDELGVAPREADLNWAKGGLRRMGALSLTMTGALSFMQISCQCGIYIFNSRVSIVYIYI